MGMPALPPLARPLMPALGRPAGRSGVSAGFLLLVTVAVFAVSGGMLWKVGINYEGLTGNGPSKIHPSTYLACLFFAWTVLSAASIPGTLADMAERRPASLFLLAATFLYFAAVVSRGGPGMAGLLDTFLPPALIAMVLARARRREMRLMEIAIHLVMAVNALMGIGEFASGTLVFPYRFDGDVFSTDERSTALQGHPLVNATITATYLLALLPGGGRTLSSSLRLALIALQGLALVTFGGRSAMVAVLMLGGGYALAAMHRRLRGGKVSLPAAAFVVLLLTLVPFVVAGLALGGFFDALLARFVADGGSANARVAMLALFEPLSWRDLLLGPDPEWVDSLRRENGLEWGLENPILRTVLYQGIAVTLLQTLAVVLFLREIVRVSGPGTLLPTLAFVLLINTSESLGGKTTMLTKFAMIILCFFPPVPVAVSARPGRALRGGRGRGGATLRP